MLSETYFFTSIAFPFKRFVCTFTTSSLCERLTRYTANTPEIMKGTSATRATPKNILFRNRSPSVKNERFIIDKIPNHKHQVPNNFQLPNSETFGIWNFIQRPFPAKNRGLCRRG